MSSTPNYSKYSIEELYDVYNEIDKEKYPDNYEALINEIRKRKSKEKEQLEERELISTRENENIVTKDDYISEIVDPLNDSLKLNYRYVAYILIFNSLIVFSQIAFLNDIDKKVLLASVVVDLVLSITLIIRPTKLLANIVALRVGLGLLIYPLIYFPKREYLLILIQVVYNSAIIFLIIGKPDKRLRNIAASIAFTLLLFITVLTFNNIVLTNNLNYSYSLQDEPVDRIKGVYFDYILELTPNTWYIREREAALKENSAVDQWLVNPERDAHIMIIGEEILDYSLNLNTFKENVLSYAKNASNQFRKIKEYNTKNEKHVGIIIHVKANINLLDIDYYYGLYIIKDKAFQIVAFCKSKDKKKFEQIFEDIINSFKYTGKINSLRNKRQKI